MAKTKQTSMRLSAETVAWLNRFSNPLTVQLEEDLAQLRAYTSSGVAGVADEFTEEEINLIRDSLNGTLFDPKHIVSWGHMLAANVSDSITLDGLDEKWGVDKEEILKNINSLSEKQVIGLVHSVREFWAGKGE